MSFLSSIKGAAEGAGRFISTTGAGALRKVGEGVKTVRKIAGNVDAAPGGAAGLAFEASKSMPGIGAVTSNIERGLNAAEKGSSMGLKAIELGQRASKVKNVVGAKGVYDDARGLYKSGRG
jgi:hypothetical protein